MSYEDILIRESTGEGMGLPAWCSACERDAEDCVCEELSDHFRDVDAAYAISAEESSRSEPADFLGRVGSESAVRRACKSDKTGSGGMCAVSCPPETHTLPEPESFEDWLKQSEDSI